MKRPVQVRAEALGFTVVQTDYDRFRVDAPGFHGLLDSVSLWQIVLMNEKENN